MSWEGLLRSNKTLRAIARCLREHPGGVAARTLAERFLRLECDEETARRLLDPTLRDLPGAVYRVGAGWILEERPADPGEGVWDDFVAVAAAPPGRPGAPPRLAWVRFVDGRPLESAGPSTPSRLRPAPAGAPVVVGGDAEERRAVRAWLADRAEEAGPLLSLRRLERAAGNPLRRRERPEEESEADPAARARQVGWALQALAPRMRSAGLRVADLAAAGAARAAPDPVPPGFDRSSLKSLPAAPGVYRFLDDSGTAYYVGKSRNLRARVRSYFGAAARRSARVRRLLERLGRVEFEPLETEADSLLEEQRSIRRDRPIGNLQLAVREANEDPLACGRWAVVAPGAGGRGGCSLFVLVQGRLAARLRRARPGQRRRLQGALARAGRIPTSLASREGGEQVRRWVSRRPQEFSLVDLDAAAGVGEALRLLVEVVRHYAGGEREPVVAR